jgi:lipoprotein NlpI
MAHEQHTKKDGAVNSCWACLSELGANDKVCPFCNAYQSGLPRHLNRALFVALLILLAGAIAQFWITLAGLQRNQISELNQERSQTMASSKSQREKANIFSQRVDLARREIANGTSSDTKSLNAAIRDYADVTAVVRANEENILILGKQLHQLDRPLYTQIPKLGASSGLRLSDWILRKPARTASDLGNIDEARGRMSCLDDVKTCQDESGDTAIAACTRIIESGEMTGEDQAVNYRNRGDEYRTKREFGRARADFNEALRLDPEFADAFVGRGLTYHAEGGYGHALADYGEALRLAPESADAFKGRALIYQAEGDYDHALADYGEAIRVSSEKAGMYRYRGVAFLYHGDLAKALADLGQAHELDSSDAYSALWLDIVGYRNKTPSQLKQAASTIDMTVWPGPLIRLFLGEADLAQTTAAANDDDPDTKQLEVCEVNFFAGELALRSNKEEAIRLFRLASGNCGIDSLEWTAAKAELKILGVAP